MLFRSVAGAIGDEAESSDDETESADDAESGDGGVSAGVADRRGSGEAGGPVAGRSMRGPGVDAAPGDAEKTSTPGDADGAGGEPAVGSCMGTRVEACTGGAACTSITGASIARTAGDSCTGTKRETPGGSSDNKEISYLRKLGPCIAGSFAGKVTGWRDDTSTTTPGVA